MSDQSYPGQDPGYGQQPSFGQQPDYGYGQQPPYDPTQPPQFPPDQPYDPNQTAQYPPSPPPYDPNQTAQLPQAPPPYEAGHAGPYGQPLYPEPGYDQPPPYSAPPQYPAAPPPGGGGNRVVLVLAVIMVLTTLGVAGYFLFAGSDSDSAADRGGRPTASNVNSPSRQPASPPNVPPVSIPPIDLPSGSIALCSVIRDPQTVAIAYVGAAELGQPNVAQACVWQDSVPRSLTESLDTGGQTLYAPAGGHGSTYKFTSADGGAHLTVTVTRENDGNFYVTDVVKS